MINDTICAISTPLAKGAIGIVRMSGAESFDIIRQVAHLKPEQIRPNTIIYGHIYDHEECIDEVLIAFFDHRHSYTREDIVEINCHGGVYITRYVLSVLLQYNCRLALPGEFTQRAYLNGRIDLTKAEAINDIINARGANQSKSAMRGLNGSISRLLDPLITEIKNVLAMIEINIDYPEYEDERQMTKEVIEPYLRQWHNECAEMIIKAERFRNIKNGIKTVIVGKPNVGKSSLLNALITQDKAIVTEIAGTTRDLVEGEVSLGNVVLDLIDTAGIRESDDPIEKIGIAKSLDALKEADLVLVVLDASSPLDEEDEAILKMTETYDRLIIYNKSDLKSHDGIAISASHNDLKALIEALKTKYADDYDLLNQDVLNSERQIALLKKAEQALRQGLDDIDAFPLDVTYNNLMEAYQYLGTILGKEYQEDLIDHMFRNFCLGK